MDPFNQTFSQPLPSSTTHTEEIPVFVTYLYLMFVLMVATIVVTPSLIIINVIWQTTELHTKYFFFVANLLATDTLSIMLRSGSNYVIMILYLLGLSTDSATTILQLSIFPMVALLHLMTILLPVTLAIERMIVISFPYRHRSIMTTKTVVSILAALWGLSLIVTIMITIVVSVDIIWPLALVYYHATVALFFVIPRLTSAVLIIIVNLFLLYKVVVSNRKAKENKRLGNEDEVKKFEKLVQLLRLQIKPTITLLLMGGIDVLGNVLISSAYTTTKILVAPNTKYYLEQFLLYPITACLLLSHSLVYGLYMKKIRNRLPGCEICHQSYWNGTRSRVITLHRQP